MKTQRNILVAFLLNLAFSMFELIGGLWTGSVAILSDSVHDLGDAASIGVSFFLERHSRRPADERYSCGYLRFSVLGGLLTSCMLLIGSVFVMTQAVQRILHPVPIAYGKMVIFAVVGFGVNLLAAWFTREGDSLNQKSVNLHMLEDVLGWLVVLIGAVVMHFTDIRMLDSLMSIGVSAFILISALKNLVEIGALFLERVPHGVQYQEVRKHLLAIEGVEDVHQLQIRSLDGFHHVATMHIVTHRAQTEDLKAQIRQELHEHGIDACVLETETEACGRESFAFAPAPQSHHHH